MQDNMSLLNILAQLQMASTDSLKQFQQHEDDEEQLSYIKISTRSFEKMLEHNNKDTYKEVTVTEEKVYKSGKIVIKTRKEKVRGNEIHGRFKTYLEKTPGAKELLSLGRLYQVWEPLRDSFMHFILERDYPKYQLLTSNEEQEWVMDVCELVVRDYIMVEKHKILKTRKGSEPFVNPTIKSLMIELVEKREEVGNKAEGVNAGFKDQGLSKKQIEEMYEKGDITNEVRLELIEKAMKAKAKILDEITLDVDYRIERMRKLLPAQSVAEEIKRVQSTILEIEKEDKSA